MVWPVTAPPIPQGAVLVEPAGRIAALGPDAAVPWPPGARRFDYPEAVVLPGWVNVHTHLELTGLEGQIEETDFPEWIQHIRCAKEAASPEDFVAWARAGVRQTWRYGATTVADTGTSGAVVTALTELGGSGVVYHEAIAPDPAQAASALESLRSQVERLRAAAGPRVRLGVSPHAPYTVSRRLYREVAAYARATGLPLAGHLAESSAEVELVARAAGPFAEGWRRRGIPLDPPAASPVRLLQELGVLGPDFLAVHLVQTDQEDWEVLAATGTAAAICPRSNLRHGHGAPPLKALLQRGLRVGLGTDSAASVESLDLVAEARQARLLAGLSAEQALRLITLEGARALGLEAEIGSLEVGKWADLVVIAPSGPVPPAADLAAEAVLLARPGEVVATFVAGRPVYRRDWEGGAGPS